ncbi:hypothetical protein [uncultured Hoeflea sp.]|uniref:hypothetical protein n=1 Tax=uncultured Hoeflea sp. TaxID=538666 RepID=UPI0030EC95CB|tara:strand:- start:43359 stop:46901 length:3543 start_codon:yes stop_codon:yes gene_type:complete
MTSNTPNPSTQTSTPETEEEAYKRRLLAEADRLGLAHEKLPTISTGSRDMMGDAMRLIDAKRGFTPPPVAEPESLAETINDGVGTSLSGAKELWQSVGGGIAKAGFETQDFLLGEPEEDEKSALRRDVEARSAELSAKSPANALASGISQFATGMLGAGKLAGPIKAVQGLRKAGKAGAAAYEIGRGAAVGAIVIDPHEERLSNLVEQFPALENPVTRYLAASPDDGAAEGRLKNALEGIGLDLAVVGVFAAAAKAFRMVKAGDQPGLEAALSELDGASAPPKSTALKANSTETLPAPSGARQDAASGMVGELPSSPATPVSDSPSAVVPQAAEPDVSAIMLQTEADLAAIREHGSREDAIANGYRFARGSLPWQKLNGSEEVRSFMSNTAAASKARLDTIKGGDVLSDLKVREMVNERARLFGEDPTDTLGQLAAAGESAKSMAADMEASFLLSNRMLSDAYEVAFRIRNGMLEDWGGDAARAGAELKRRMAAASEVLGSAMSMRSAAGRTMRRMRSDFRITPEDIAKIEGMDAGKLADLLYNTKGDPKTLVEAANPNLLQRAVNEGVFSLTNSLLWLYPTHVVNLTTNAYMLAARPTEKLIGSLAMGNKGSAVRQQALKEYSGTLAALGDGWEAMVEAFKRGDSALSPHGDEYLIADHKALALKPVRSVGDLLENGWRSLNYRNVVGLPTRALGAVDEFMKTLRYRAVIQAKAAVEANAQRLEGQAFRGHIERRMAEAFDAQGRGIDSAALQEAQTATFQQELLPKTIGATILQTRTNHPALGFILPFVKTPVNVFRYSWKMTPGLNLLQTEYRQMLKGAKGPEAQAQAVGQMTLGATFMGLAAALALEGRITGSGPKDPALRSSLRATGWQPHAITWVDGDDKRHYFPLGRFDPVGLPMGIIADLVDAERLHPGSRDLEKGRVGMLVALASNFTDKSFLLSLNQVLRAATEPETHLGRVAGQTAANTIPLSSLLRGTNPDPHIREARSFMDQIMKNLPGFSETLPPKRDSFGEPLWSDIGLMTTEDADLVEAEHNRIVLETGYGVRPPAATRNGVDLRDVTLSDGRNAYDLYQELAGSPGAGKPMKQALAKLIQSDAYQTLVDGPSDVKGTKLGAIARVVGKYREFAFRLMLKKYPEFRQLIHQRQLQVKSEVSANLKAKASREAGGVEELLKSLGY